MDVLVVASSFVWSVQSFAWELDSSVVCLETLQVDALLVESFSSGQLDL